MIDLSTIGVKFGWAVETVASKKPESFKQIPRCKNIGGISLEADNIDTTALEDSIRTYVAGLKDTGGSWTLTFGLNDDLATKWDALVTASAAARKTGLATWAVIYIPGLTKSFYVTFEPGDIPMPEIEVSSALEAEISCIINEYKGLDTKTEPTAA